MPARQSRNSFIGWFCFFRTRSGERTTHEIRAEGDFPDDDGIDNHALDSAKAEAEGAVPPKKWAIEKLELARKNVVSKLGD